MTGLEALHNPKIKLAEIDIDITYMPFYKTKQYTAIEQELKALETLKDLIGDIEIEQYNKKPQRYELKICGKVFYINQEEYLALKEILL